MSPLIRILTILCLSFFSLCQNSFGQTLSITATDTSICSGDSVLLAGSPGFSNYQWNTGIPFRFLFVKAVGMYTLTAQDTAGNTVKDSIYIGIYPVKNFGYELEPDTHSICEGDTMNILLSPGFPEYRWNTGDDDRELEIIVNEDKHLVAEAVDSNGCVYRHEIDLEAINCDSACENLIIYSDSVSCNDSVVIEVKSGFADYDWSDGKDGRIRWVKESGWYKVSAEHADGTLCTDSVYITIHEKQELNIFSNKTGDTLCKGDSIVIEVSEGFTQYWWNTGHDGDRNVLYPSYSFNLVVEAEDSNGCEYRATLPISVVDCDKMCEDIIGSSDFITCFYDSIQLEVQSGFEAYEWTDGVEGRIRWVNQEGWYTVRVEDEYGRYCKDSIKVYFYEEEELIIYSNLNPAVLCPGDSIVIELSGYFEQYWWSTGHDGDRNVLYPQESFNLVIEAVDTNGCEYRSTLEIQVKDSCTMSIYSLKKTDGIKIYPNPAQSHVTIQFIQPINNVVLYTLQGEQLQAIEPKSREVTVDLHSFPPGSYLLQIDQQFYKLLIQP